MSRRVHLIRHGETEGESSIRYHGRNDVALELYRRIRNDFPESRFVPDSHMALAESRFAGYRDIIHGAAHELARRKGQSIEPGSFADALHDYRDALRFDPQPLMTE